ncbi:MAG: hypothetical protein ACM32O_19285, partial [Clostridia bacterium]
MSVQSQVHFVLSCQLPSGAFLLGKHDHRIIPYFTHMALLSLLDAGEYEPVRRYLDWYLAHRGADGYVNDYIWRNGSEVDTGKADSEDSYHSTFFTLVLAYQAAVNDFYWARENCSQLQSILTGLIALQQRNGLTWAKRSYKVAYLMDNCETYLGLCAAEALFTQIGDMTTASTARERARWCAEGIMRMYDERKQAFAVYDKRWPNWNKWYPDATSQAFPVLAGLAMAQESKSRQLYERFTYHFPRFDQFDTGD